MILHQFFCKELTAGKCTTGLKRMCRATFSASYNYCSLYSYFRCRQGFHNVPNEPPSEMTFPPPSSRGYLSDRFQYSLFFLEKQMSEEHKVTIAVTATSVVVTVATASPWLALGVAGIAVVGAIALVSLARNSSSKHKT